MNILSVMQYRKPVDKPARMVFKDMVYYQPFHGNPVSKEESYAAWLVGDIEPAPRRMNLDEEWKPIDCNWIDEASAIFIENLEGRYLDRIPTDSQIHEISQRIIEVAFLPENPSPDIWIPPMACQRLRVVDFRRIRLRSKAGPVQCEITVFPL